jgi:hypothetical protein
MVVMLMSRVKGRGGMRLDRVLDVSTSDPSGELLIIETDNACVLQWPWQFIWK